MDEKTPCWSMQNKARLVKTRIQSLSRLEGGDAAPTTLEAMDIAATNQSNARF